jgi:HSP20 family molecular chaperone IbpA
VEAREEKIGGKEMYTTMANPWQSSGFTTQPFFTPQSFLPFQTYPQIQGYNMPLQTSAVTASPWGYNLPFSNVMFSPAGNIQTGFIPQGAISYGFNPSWGWQAISPVGAAQINPQMQQMPGMSNLTTGIRASAGFTQPRIELAETNNDVIVTADLPNVDPNNIYITATDDSLSISALAYMGGITSSLHRTVALPTNIRSEHIDVSYTNGTLECRLPKSDLAVRRRVKVNATG